MPTAVPCLKGSGGPSWGSWCDRRPRPLPCLHPRPLPTTHPPAHRGLVSGQSEAEKVAAANLWRFAPSSQLTSNRHSSAFLSSGSCYFAYKILCLPSAYLCPCVPWFVCVGFGSWKPQAGLQVSLCFSPPSRPTSGHRHLIIPNARGCLQSNMGH